VPVFFADLQKTDEESLRQHIIDSYIGITSADFCMADTATLVMRTRPGQARSVSLVPAIHIAVVELNRIIADLKELYALLKWDPQESKDGVTNCMTFISGPSKTADIEATMVHGAHGPREVHLFVLATEF
jgi:L-lactate dehydrogenase complex protein LldG